ncbi:MAG TPA: O-antigen ligase family protein [Terriglobia bacterium]
MVLINGLVGLTLLIALLENREPLIPAAALVMVLLWSVPLRLSKGLGFRRLEWAIVICLAYWLLNYSWSTADFQNLISYEFLRHDGAPLVSYTAFLGFLGWPLKPKQLRNFWVIFVLLFALIAIPSVAYCAHLFPVEDVMGRLGTVAFEPSIGARMFVGWYEAHNTTGGVYALGSLLALTVVREAKLTPKLKQFMWVVFLCCLAGLLFTYSRGSYLGFLAGLALIVPLRKLGTVIRVGLLIGVPVVLLGVMTSTVFNRIDTITDPYYGTNAARFTIWEDALQDIATSPIVGIGFGRFNDVAVDFKGIKGLYWIGVSGKIVNGDDHAHNSYLHFWAEGGIIGLWLTLRVWWCAWAELCFFESKMPKSSLHVLRKAAKACLVGTLVMSFTEHLLGRGSVVLLLMSLVGMTLAASRLEWRAVENAQDKLRGRMRRFPGVIQVRPTATVSQ